MKKIYSIILTISLTIGGLCFNNAPIKADMFGIADATLLMQQIFQYIQDGSRTLQQMGELRVMTKQIKDEAKSVHKMMNTIYTYKKVYTTVNSVATTTHMIANTLSDIADYVNFIGQIGDVNHIRDAHSIYESYNKRTQCILGETKDALRMLSKIEGKPLEIMNTADNICNNFRSQILGLDSDTRRKMKNIISEIDYGYEQRAYKNFHKPFC